MRIGARPLSEIGVSAGVVKLIYNPELLSLAPDSSESFNAKEIESARLLEGHYTLFSKAKAAAPTTLSATYTTKYGKFEATPITILLRPQSETTAPFIERSGSKEINLSGEWRIEVGALSGGMKIRQDQRNDIHGTYWLLTSNGREELAIEGYKDGTSFKVFLLRDPNDITRWRIDSNFALNATDSRFIEIKGCAYAITRDALINKDSAVESDKCQARSYVGWKGTGASVFYATAQIK